MEDIVEVNFARLASQPGTGKGFEIRIHFEYMENGVEKAIVIGPTSLITENLRCTAGNNNICYQYGDGALLSAMKVHLNDENAIYTYIDEPSCDVPENVARSLRLEVTAIDTFLTNYIIANDPKFEDFLSTRPEYTNLEGSDEVVGVFGAIASDIEYALIGDCSEYLLRLNNTPKPESCVE